MSKSALKKELLTFTGPQLVEVILNAYSSSKEAKEYFEFFLNPDAEALLEKKTDLIARELARAKHGYSKARISHIRRYIKDVESFGVGPEKTGELMMRAIRMIMIAYRRLNFTETLFKGLYKLVADYITVADGAGYLQHALAELTAVTDDKAIGTQALRSSVKTVMANTIADMAAR